jgi:transposase
MSQSNVLVKNGKRISVSAQDEAFVGLDTHVKHVNVAVRLNGELVARWMGSPKDAKIAESLRPLVPALRRVVYEAGPTGYGLYRSLKAEGMPVEVWAPGKVPQPANRTNKTDRKDARTLAEYAQKDMCTPIRVPTLQEEADRQVMRTRNQLAKKVRRAKQQVKSFLYMHGIPTPTGLESWTKQARAALRTLCMGPELRSCLDLLIAELECLEGLKKQAEQNLRELARTPRHAAAEGLLRSHPGVGELTAMNFLLEIYQPERFEVDRQLTTYLGLVPRVSQTGERRIEGPLIRSGQNDLRSKLVQAAWQWVNRGGEGKVIYLRLLKNTKCAQKAIVGVARKIAVNLWYMLLRGKEYRPSAETGPGRRDGKTNGVGQGRKSARSGRRADRKRRRDANEAAGKTTRGPGPVRTA